VIPSADLDRSAIHYTYAGVRPLPFASDGAEGAITRRHILCDHAGDGASGLISIIGGKLTTYRELAAQVVDWAQRWHDVAVTPSRTEREALPGAEGLGADPASFRQTFIAESGLPARSAAHLVDIYGGRAHEVLALANTEELRRPFDEWSGAIGAEVVFAFAKESATTLTDVLMRRTMVGLGPDLGCDAVEAAAAIAAAHFDWDHDRVRSELTDYRYFIARLEPESPC
jgi:glycerol-3-phosphate dehydrogenase